MVRGVDANGVDHSGVDNQGIIFPGQTTQAQALVLGSSAIYDNIGEELVSVYFYLDGAAADLSVVQGLWPGQGGGMQISFDQGATYQTFKQGASGVGDKMYPDTWLSLSGKPKSAGGPSILESTSTATILTRLVVPAQATQYELYLLTLQPDFDIL